jgi:hypothetical protein
VTKHYTESAWHNLPNFECAYCPYATLSEEDIKKHIEAVHLAPVPTKPSVTATPALDRFGNIVVKGEEG